MATWLSLAPGVAAQPVPPPIEGVWYLNRELSDMRPPRDDSQVPDGRVPPGPGGGRGRGGGPGRGGFGGGPRRGAGRGAGRDPEAMRRGMEAMRAILEPAERLTIVRTASMVIVTSDHGVTTRLSPDNSRVKDASTGLDRRSRWEDGRLVTDIRGAGPGRIVETYGYDAGLRQLVVELKLEGGRGGSAPRALRRVYEKDE